MGPLTSWHLLWNLCTFWHLFTLLAKPIKSHCESLKDHHKDIQCMEEPSVLDVYAHTVHLIPFVFKISFNYNFFNYKYFLITNISSLFFITIVLQLEWFLNFNIFFQKAFHLQFLAFLKMFSICGFRTYSLSKMEVKKDRTCGGHFWFIKDQDPLTH